MSFIEFRSDPYYFTAAMCFDLLFGSIVGTALQVNSDTKSPARNSASSAGSNVSKHGIYQCWEIPADVLGNTYHFSLSDIVRSHCKCCTMKPLSLVVTTQAVRALNSKNVGLKP